jgi:hypothetical protein
MATDPTDGSNRVVGPGILGCGDWSIYDCFAQYRPENLNIVAENFYEETVPSSGQPFDFVREVLRFDEYARTAPIVTVSSPTQPAPTGWYNAAVLGGQGNDLQVDVSAADYRWPTGINAISCADTGNSSNFTFPLATTVPTGDGYGTATESATVGEGIHSIGCTATDGAAKGLHGVGNSGDGPGSTTPGAFKVDTVPPVIQCPGGTDAQLSLHQPVSSLTGLVSDATSGVATSSTSAPISTANVGSFTATLTAADNAGNIASVVCSYTVSYVVALRYDKTKQWTVGSTIPIKIELDDYFGVDVSVKSIVVTAKTVTNTLAATRFAPTSPGATKNFAFLTAPKNGYEYDLQTKGYQSGPYTLDFIAGNDPVTHHAPFLIK